LSRQIVEHSKSFWLTFHILGELLFSGLFTVIMDFSKSISIHSNRLASPALMAVSLSSCSIVETRFPDPEISWSSSSSFEIDRSTEFGFDGLV